jgi:hypothetical protein
MEDTLRHTGVPAEMSAKKPPADKKNLIRRSKLLLVDAAVVLEVQALENALQVVVVYALVQAELLPLLLRSSASGASPAAAAPAAACTQSRGHWSRTRYFSCLSSPIFPLFPASLPGQVDAVG